MVLHMYDLAQFELPSSKNLGLSFQNNQEQETTYDHQCFGSYNFVCCLNTEAQAEGMEPQGDFLKVWWEFSSQKRWTTSFMVYVERETHSGLRLFGLMKIWCLIKLPFGSSDRFIKRNMYHLSETTTRIWDSLQSTWDFSTFMVLASEIRLCCTTWLSNKNTYHLLKSPSKTRLQLEFTPNLLLLQVQLHLENKIMHAAPDACMFD